MQRAISIFGALALLTATTTVAGAVGDITGTVTHVHPVSNIVKFNDGRTIYLDPGATFTVDGRQVSIDQIKPGMRVNIAGGRLGDEGTAQGTAQPSQRAAQSGTMSLPAGHPPVDVSGKVARYDAATNILTFEDGRMIKLSPQASVWQQGSTSAVAPGSQVFVRGGQPIGYRSAWNASSMPLHRMGTVLNVDPASALIVMSDGTVVKVSPAAKVQSEGQALRVTDLKAGDEVVVVGKPLAGSSGTTTSATDASGMASPGAQTGTRAQAGSPAIRAGSLPAFYNATFDASEIHLIRKPQSP